MPTEEELAGVRLSHLDKILYPVDGITKREVVEYYIRIAPRMLPWLQERAVVLTRYPEGTAGEGFYAKDAPQGTPNWVRIAPRYSDTAGRNVHYIVIQDLKTLIWIANLAAIEIHMPLARLTSPDNPDVIFFDIDPEPPAGFDAGREAAFLLRDALVDNSLQPYVKMSGKKGLHVLVPVEPPTTFAKTRAFAHAMGRVISQKKAGIVSEASESQKAGTVFMDYLQNSHGKTMICPYSLRAAPGAPVSTPVSWEELASIAGPESFNIRNILSRKEDPWEKLAQQIFHGKQV
ncbi:MAG: non-homologous end-joining DNA ligase [Methanomicrobiales archaeon]|nr:non-homologous end-joining DNA ligase [Methanomicrobiales archaeon]